VGPGLLQAIATVGRPGTTAFDVDVPCIVGDDHRAPDDHADSTPDSEEDTGTAPMASPTSGRINESDTEVAGAEISTDDDLLDRARRANAQHWPSTDARSQPTPSAETFTSAPPAQGTWYRSSELTLLSILCPVDDERGKGIHGLLVLLSRHGDRRNRFDAVGACGGASPGRQRYGR